MAAPKSSTVRRGRSVLGVVVGDVHVGDVLDGRPGVARSDLRQIGAYRFVEVDQTVCHRAAEHQVDCRLGDRHDGDAVFSGPKSGA